jgi:hypothetical protein
MDEREEFHGMSVSKKRLALTRPAPGRGSRNRLASRPGS